MESFAKCGNDTCLNFGRAFRRMPKISRIYFENKYTVYRLEHTHSPTFSYVLLSHTQNAHFTLLKDIKLQCDEIINTKVRDFHITFFLCILSQSLYMLHSLKHTHTHLDTNLVKIEVAFGFKSLQKVKYTLSLTCLKVRKCSRH